MFSALSLMAEYRESGNNDDFLKDLRDNCASDEGEWHPIRTEGQKDIKFIGGDPWDAEEKRYRASKGRLCLSFDELGQYTNQAINDLFQNKRAIKVTPISSGASDKEAELRADAIRQIEYRSNAQQAYTVMFENAIQRSFGWVRVFTRYVDPKTKGETEIVIGSIPNPDMITPGPFVMPNGSDLKRLTNREVRTHAEFKREFPRARIKDLSSTELMSLDNISGWLRPNQVTIAEHWVKDEDGHVCQYFTNGIEIFKKVEWPGKEIPFVPCLGKVLYVQSEGKTERQIHSMIRLAREPFQAYCFTMTSIAEKLAQMPKFPYFVRKGSLSAASLADLVRSVTEPVAAIEVEAMLPEMQTGPPEFPQRNPIDLADIQAGMAAAEAFRRTIQAAIGQSPLPTMAQRRNEKSGVALKEITDTGQRGSYHFVAHHEAAVTRVGEILNDLLTSHHGTEPKGLAVRKADDKTQMVQLNDPSWVNPDTQQPEHLAFSDAGFDVTLSTGPAVDSEREAASDFADLLLQSPEIAQIVGPEVMKQIIAISIKLKDVGPLGDQMAELISPSKQQGQDDPQQMKAQMQKAQQAMDMQSKQLEALTQQLQTDQVKADNAIKLQDLKNQHDIALQVQKDATAIKVAWLNARSKGVQIQMEADEEMIALGMDQQHEATQNEADRQHEAAMQAMQGGQAAQQTDQQGTQQAQQSAQDHQQQLEQGAAGHEQSLEQGAQQAALAPQPEA